jgi:lipoate-protein ligase B
MESAAAGSGAIGKEPMGSDPSVRLHAWWLGRVAYREALALQTELQQEVMDRRGDPGYLLLLEHPPVITAGRSAQPAELRASTEELTRRGVELVETSRGGRYTYHGPGQLVGYPVLDLKACRADVHWYMRQLEEVLIRVLGGLGVEAGRVPGQTGVWVGDRKIASIGVAIRRWVTAHGFALNVAPDMKHFGLLQPCGLSPGRMLSLAELLREVPPMQGLARAAAEAFAQVFGLGPGEMVFEERAAAALSRQGVR